MNRVENICCASCMSHNGKCRYPAIFTWINKQKKTKYFRDAPLWKLPRGEQKTAIGSSSSSEPLCLTAISTKIKLFIPPSGPPTQSNGIDSFSCHTGLNPLFLITLVQRDTCRAEEAAFEIDDLRAASVAGLYSYEGDEGVKGAADQSGMWSVTST